MSESAAATRAAGGAFGLLQTAASVLSAIGVNSLASSFTSLTVFGILGLPAGFGLGIPLVHRVGACVSPFVSSVVAGVFSFVSSVIAFHLLFMGLDFRRAMCARCFRLEQTA